LLAAQPVLHVILVIFAAGSRQLAHRAARQAGPRAAAACVLDR
jgi:hypothetical protein